MAAASRRRSVPGGRGAVEGVPVGSPSRSPLRPSLERRPPVNAPLPPSRPPGGRGTDVLPGEFGGGLFEQGPPAQEVRLAHREGPFRGGGLAPGDTGPLSRGPPVRTRGDRTRPRIAAGGGSPTPRRAASIRSPGPHRSRAPAIAARGAAAAYRHVKLPVRLRRAERRDHPLVRFGRSAPCSSAGRRATVVFPAPGRPAIRNKEVTRRSCQERDGAIGGRASDPHGPNVRRAARRTAPHDVTLLP